MYIDLTVIILIGFLVGGLYLMSRCLNSIDPDDKAYYDEMERTREHRIERGACVAPFS